MSNFTINRRRFLQYTGCGAMSATSLFSSMINLRALQASASMNSLIDDDYRALVCIALAGGNDSYNMLVPMENDEYDTYRTTRSNVAIEKDELLPLNRPAGARRFGLHPTMKNMQRHFNDGNVAFLANVGTLVEPMSVDEYFLKTKRAPLGLLSHSDQQQQWQTALPHERSARGWAGQISELIQDAGMYNTGSLPMNISMRGANIWQSSDKSQLYSISPTEGPIGFEDYFNDEHDLTRRAINSILELEYQDAFKRTYLKQVKNSKEAFLAFQEAFDLVDINTRFTRVPTRAEESLYQVAKAIASSERLGFKRQTFFVEIGGFDTHDNIGVQHDRLLGGIDQALADFYEALKEIGAEDKVVTFTISDFARTMGSNGNGTDHAWGGHMMMMGGPVKGGQIYGKYPETLSLSDNPDDIGGGIILPSTSADEYFAELALWFGVNPSDLGTVFPNLVNFYDFRTAADRWPLEFLAR